MAEMRNSGTRMVKQFAIVLQVGLLLAATLADPSPTSAKLKSARKSGLHYLDRNKWHKNWSLIDKQGKKLSVNPSYRVDGYFTSGIDKFATKIKGKWKYGYINAKCEVVIPPKYNYASCVFGDVALVGLSKNKLSLIDTSGKEISKFPKNLHLNYLGRTGIGFYSSGLLSVTSNRNRNKHGFIDLKGKIVVPVKYDHVEQFKNGFALVKRDQKYGFVDTFGNEVVPPQFLYASGFSEGLAAIYTKIGGGFIDTTGRIVISPEYNRVGDFSEGMARFKKNGKWGYINKEGNVVVKPVFREVYNFSEGIACVRLNEKWGFIGKNGNFVIKPKYYLAESFKNGTAACAIDFNDQKNDICRIEVSMGDNLNTRIFIEDRFEPVAFQNYIKPIVKFGLIDMKGVFVLKPKYDAIFGSHGGLRKVILDSKYGFINDKGEELAPPSFSNARNFLGKVAWVKKFDKNDRELQRKLRDPIINFSGHCSNYYPPIDPDLIEANIHICTKVIKEYPSINNAYYLRAKFFYALRKYNWALLDLDKAIERDPTNYEFLVLRGYTHLELKNWKKAELDFRKSIGSEVQPYGIALRRQLMPGESIYFGLRKSLIMQNKTKEFLDIVVPQFPFSLNSVVINKSDDLCFNAYMKLKKYKEAECSLSGHAQGTNYSIPYPMTESELNDKYKELTEELKAFESNRRKAHSLFLTKRKLDLLFTLNQLIECSKARYRVLDLKQFLEKKIELFPALNPYKMKYSKGRLNGPGCDSIYSLKYKLAQLHSELNDKQAEQFYLREIKTVRDLTAYMFYAEYLAKNGKLEKALTIYSKISGAVDLEIKKAYLLKRLGRESEAEKLIQLAKKKSRRRVLRTYGASIRPLYSESKLEHLILPNAPIPKGKCTAKGFFELAKRSNDLGLVNASIRYASKAEKSTKDDSLRAEIQQFRKIHLPSKRISLRTNARYFSNRVPFMNYGFNYDPETEVNLKSCIKEERGFTKPYVDLMRFYNNIGNFEDAAKIYEQVMKVNSDCLGAWVEAGRMYNLQGKKKETKNAFLKVQELDPGNQFAKVIIESLDHRIENQLTND